MILALNLVALFNLVALKSKSNLGLRIKGARLLARPHSDYIIFQLNLELASDTNVNGAWIAIGHLITTTESCQIEALNTSALISQIANGQCCLP